MLTAVRPVESGIPKNMMLAIVVGLPRPTRFQEHAKQLSFHIEAFHRCFGDESD